MRDDVRLLNYRGSVKGPLGTLWESAGSPEEKLALCRAILTHCANAPAVTVENVAPDRNRAADADTEG